MKKRETDKTGRVLI